MLRMYNGEEIVEDPTREIFYNSNYTTIMNFIQANNWNKQFSSILDKYFWIEYVNRRGDEILNKKYLKSLVDQNAVVLIHFIVNKIDSLDEKDLINYIFQYSVEKKQSGDS